MAYVRMAYVLMAYVLMAYVPMAYVPMAYLGMAYIVMAYIVMAYKFSAKLSLGSSLSLRRSFATASDFCPRDFSTPRRFHKNRQRSCGPISLF